jgi:hypothetical protein
MRDASPSKDLAVKIKIGWCLMIATVIQIIRWCLITAAVIRKQTSCHTGHVVAKTTTTSMADELRDAQTKKLQLPTARRFVRILPETSNDPPASCLEALAVPSLNRVSFIRLSLMEQQQTRSLLAEFWTVLSVLASHSLGLSFFLISNTVPFSIRP